MEKLINGASTSTLSSGITGSATTLSVASASGFPASGNFRIRIGDEIMLVTGVSGTTFTVTRAQEGTSGTAHSSGDPVDFYLTKGTLDALRKEMYSSDTYANRLSAPREGSIYFPTDGYVMCRYDGSAWENFGPITKLTPPGSSFGAGYSWFQQGSATFTQNGQSWILKVPGETGGLVRTVYKTAPATPYTIECGMRFLAYPVNYASAGMVWKQSSDNAHLHYGCMFHNLPNYCHLLVDKYNGSGGFVAAYATGSHYTCLDFAPFFRFTDNGTNRLYDISQDGKLWYNYLTHGRTDHITPNQIGFGAQNSNSKDNFLEIFHYKEY